MMFLDLCRPPREGEGTDAGQSGFVLLSVLAVLVVVSAILAAALLQVRSETATIQARGDGVRLQGLADGIGQFVAYDLRVARTHRVAGLGLPEDGAAVACPLGRGRTAFVALQDQGRLIDLNTTPRPALEEAFRLLGLPDPTVLALAAEIVDARDPDDVPEPNGGAERAQYRARGLASGPRNGPFVRVDEIGRLPSMTPDVAAILTPVLTVYNEGGRFDLAALIARVRPSSVRSLPAGGRPVPSPRQYFRMSVVVERNGARAGRAAVYALGGTRAGTDFLVWQHGAAAQGPAAPHPACRKIAAVLNAGAGSPDGG
jgi:general secretion pathway protein K